MKVLVTGANGFVGSHIVDCLRTRNIPVAALIRRTSNRRFLEHLPDLELREGSINDRPSIDAALHDITHVIHVAGVVKALTIPEFYEANQVGSRHVVAAINQRRGQIQRLVHISSRAAMGATSADAPAREDGPTNPVSDYGRSKLAGEQEVTGGCQVDYAVIRPPAVYGPRDGEFLRLFKAVQSHVLPLFGGGRQTLSMVFVRDLAEVAVLCLTAPGAVGKIFFAAAPEVVTTRELALEIKAQLRTWAMPLPLPMFVLWPICLAQECLSKLTGRANVLSRQKYAELTATGWVCDVSRLQKELGHTCPTHLSAGVAQTLAWYRQQGWLK